MITIPQKSVPTLPKVLFAGMSASSIVVDTGNYYPTIRDGQIDALQNGLAESQWVSQQIGRPVIKAFNSILADSLVTKGRAMGAPDQISLPIAGDSIAAKAR